MYCKIEWFQPTYGENTKSMVKNNALLNLKLDLYDKKTTNKLKVRILSETSKLYLIRHSSVILIVGLHL